MVNRFPGLCMKISKDRGQAWETPMKGPDPPEAKVVVDLGWI
jgi:hypothetical protein